MKQIRPRTSLTPIRSAPDRILLRVDLRDKPIDYSKPGGTDRQSEPVGEQVTVDPDDRSVVPWGFFEDDDS
jgi:hypothetical protein